MHCFTSHNCKKMRHKKSLAEQDASAKMTRTFSAPPSFNLTDSQATLSSILSAPSPLNPHAPPRKSNSLIKNNREGSASPLVMHSGGIIPSGYNSLSGLRRDSIFRGQPLPLPTPESCGLSPDTSRFMPSPALGTRNGCSSESSAAAIAAKSVSSTTTDQGAAAACRNSASMPLPRPPVQRLASAHISFSPETACIGESGNGPVFTCTVSIDGGSGNVKETAQAVLIRLSDTIMQDSKGWIEQVKEIACLPDAHLSRILGFSFSTDEKLVVYEIQGNGSLDRLLYARSRERPPLNWSTRVRIAADAARGLAFLHERSPVKLMYKDFRTFNIHVDKDLRGRLMGYGFTQRFVNTKSPMVAAYAAPEVVSGEAPVSLRSNVWSFGVVLLEILTGRQNRDEIFPAEEQDLVHWTAPFLSDEMRLFLVVDPELKGMFSSRSVSAFAKVASQCLQRDAILRPGMDEVASALESALDQDSSVRPTPAAAAGGSDSRKPLIEALKECSTTASGSAALSAVQGGLQKRLVTRLLCSSALALE